MTKQGFEKPLFFFNNSLLANCVLERPTVGLSLYFCPKQKNTP